MKAILCGLGAVIGYCAIARPKPASMPALAGDAAATLLNGARVTDALMDSEGTVVAFDNGYILRAQGAIVAHLSNPFV